METRLYTSLLMDYYGNLLTDKQSKIMEMYFDENLSLGEIADLNGISRQAIHDTIKRTSQQLIKYEEKLGLKKEAERIRDIREKLLTKADEYEDPELTGLIKSL